MRGLRWFVSMTCALALAVFAEDNARPARAADAPGEGLRERPTLFISPAGQPFRAAPGEPYPVATWFAEADADHDGRITREEFRADFAAFFHTLDANHDGLIDSFEIDDYENKIAPEILSVIERPAAQARSEGGGDDEGDGAPGNGRRRRGGQGGGFGGGGRGGGSAAATGALGAQGAGAYSLLDFAEPVASADADFNGRITLPEFLAAADHRFDLLDPTGVGTLTLSTLPKTPEQKALARAKPKAP